MKKAFLVFAVVFSFFLASCPDPNEGNEDTSKISFTIRNQSSYDLSVVTWADVSFASNNAGDHLKAASSTKEVGEDDTGYIYFTRKDIGIELRTDQAYAQGDSPVTITNNTVVVEVGNDSNRGILKEITLLPRLEVEQNALQVMKNDVVNIGESTINTPPQQIPFSIKNTGKGTLTLTGNTPVKSSDPAFTVVQPASSQIAPSASLDFTLNFTPTAEKTYTTTVTITSNDKAGNFTFTVSGSGVASKPVLKIFHGENEILQSGTVTMEEALVTQSITIEIILKNTGDEVLTIDTAKIAIGGVDAAAFTKLTNPGENISPGGESRFTIQSTPTKQGENNAILTIPNNDSSRNPAVVYLKATGRLGSAVLELSQGETVIPNNGLTPVDFGQIEVGSNKTLMFTIKNTGNLPLQLTGTPKVESSHAVFTIATQSVPGSVAPGESTSFIIRYAPTAETEDTADITILNNSASLQFSFKVKGNGYARTPQITLKQGNANILNHGEYDFGLVSSDVPKEVVFTIGNSGDAALTFVTVNDNRINLTDNAAGLFTVTQQPAPTTNVIPGNTASFTIRFSPVSDGNFNATVNIKTNSKTDDEFVFTVSGRGMIPKPIIGIFYSNTEILQNSTIDSGETFTEVPIGQEIIIKNTGTALLTLGTITITGADATAFSLATSPSPNISAGTD
ncbi:MAG: choice-of-anchor D domain-containing protein [Treponema sp.]|jgi:hypothetical protein|nr:choice-of-anchor D domain-containing protein [Treponema sp.]